MRFSPRPVSQGCKRGPACIRKPDVYKRQVSYNAYLVADEKVALIDTVEEAFGSRLFENIRETIGDRPIDYLVVNHMEPDHSSSILSLIHILSYSVWPKAVR